LKKRTKKLLPVSVRASLIGRANQQNRSFLFLFSKKKYFLASPRERLPLVFLAHPS
jgi:hypothetical protein